MDTSLSKWAFGALCVLVAAVGSLWGCDDESESSAGTPCQQAWQARCDRACACQSGPQCSFAPGGWTDDGGTTIVPASVVDSEDSCRGLLERINCGADRQGVFGADYATCQAEVAGAACEDFEIDGQQYSGVVPVSSCDFL
jgi:hypothetical protein